MDWKKEKKRNEGRGGGDEKNWEREKKKEGQFGLIK